MRVRKSVFLIQIKTHMAAFSQRSCEQISSENNQAFGRFLFYFVFLNIAINDDERQSIRCNRWDGQIWE